MPHLSWGHLLFSDDAAIVLRHVRHIVQVRDPYDWVLARTRFFLSDTFQGSLVGGGAIEVPDELSDMQKSLVDYAAPGLRKILGYEQASDLSIMQAR
jgi:hypothetical protein